MFSRGARSYPVPSFLTEQGISQHTYGKWLDKVTAAITKRDRVRLKPAIIMPAVVRSAVHNAVCDGGDKDYYTGEPLDWRLLQHFNLEPTRADKANHYRAPSVDHYVLSATNPVFRICSLRTNKCKSDYSLQELEDFCKKFLAHQSSTMVL
jgi:hypothetical protein